MTSALGSASLDEPTDLPEGTEIDPTLLDPGPSENFPLLQFVLEADRQFLCVFPRNLDQTLRMFMILRTGIAEIAMLVSRTDD
jgi:hypothetical protein